MYTQETGYVEERTSPLSPTSIDKKMHLLEYGNEVEWPCFKHKKKMSTVQYEKDYPNMIKEIPLKNTIKQLRKQEVTG